MQSLGDPISTALLPLTGLLFALLSSSSLAQPALNAAGVKTLQAKLAALEADNLVGGGLVAFSIRSVKTGAPVVELNPTKGAMPASTQKLITTATALATLGGNFTFSTYLEYEGTLKGGVLQGNLYIRGTGDPTLGTDRFSGYPPYADLTKDWAARIRAAGIKQINGAVVADASLFEENALPPNWLWGDLGNYYGAGAYGLNFNENLYRIHFQPGKLVGAPAKVLRTEPMIPRLEFPNFVTTGPAGSGDNCYIYGAPYQYLQYLQGTIPAGVGSFAVRGSVPDPPYLCAFNLHGQLKKAGVGIRDSPTTDRLLRQKSQWKAGKRTLLFTHLSPPLRLIAEQTNFMSINLYAEALAKTLGLQKYGQGTTENGVKALEEYWRGKGLTTEGWFVEDGSGLSPRNGISAGRMTDILRLAGQDSTFQAFYASIPVIGVSGTVKNLCKGTKAVNNVRAKSGSIDRVRCYAGYFTAQSGERMSFAVFVNNYESEDSPGGGKRIGEQLEAILAAMVEL